MMPNRRKELMKSIELIEGVGHDERGSSGGISIVVLIFELCIVLLIVKVFGWANLDGATVMLVLVIIGVISACWILRRFWLADGDDALPPEEEKER